MIPGQLHEKVYTDEMTIEFNFQSILHKVRIITHIT